MKKMFDHKEQRFSIRKYSCGAASVLIGCVLFMGGQAVSADEQVTTDTSIETSQVNTAAKNNIQNTTGSTAVAPQTATTQKEVVEKAPAPVRSSATMMSVEKSSVDTQETTKIVDKTASAATDTRRVQSTTVDAATQTEDETTNSSVDATTDTATPSTTVKVEKNPAEKEAGKKEIDVAKLMDKTQTAHEARLAESKVIQTVPSLPSQGYYTYTKRTEVKNEPKASAALQFYVNAGDRVYYDRVLVADGYQWLSYRSYSGIRRYAAINKLVTEPVQPAKPTPSSTGTLPSRGRYTFSETAEVKNEAKWSAPTQFTFNRGDSVNYDKVLENDGYQWISYISYSGMRRYAAVTKLAQPAPQRPAQSQVTGTIHIENKTSQGFDVVVTNVSSTKGVKTVKLPIWSSQGGQDDVIWYDAIKQIDGTYKLSVDIRRHKNNRGEYNIHMYYIQSDGSLQGVTGTTTKVEEPKYSVTGTIHIENKTSQGFDVVVTDVSSTKGVKTVKLPVWSSQGGQDDIIWYDAAKQIDGTYKLSVDIRRHKNNYGDYNVHMYYVQSDGSLQGVTGTTTKVEEPKYSVTGTIHIENKTSQGFDVVVTDVSSTKGVKTVKLPIWSSQGGQDDVIWYDAVKQTDGTYKLSVDIRRHKNNYGDYNVHMYYVQSDGSLQGVMGTTTKVEEPKYSVTGTINIQNKTSQGFDVLITNVSDSNGISRVKVPIWTDKGGQDDIIWYDATKQSDGNYKVSVNIDKHKGEYGEYNIHLYYIESNGKVRGVSGTKTTVVAPSSARESIPSQGVYTFKKEVEVKNSPTMTAKTEFTFARGERIRYDKVLDADHHQWISYVSYSGTRRYIPIATLTNEEAPKPVQVTGTIHIENKTSQGFDVVVTNVSSTKGVKTVKLPVWSSQGGQDDVIWYDAAKQTDGTYKLNVDIRRHKNNRGEYNIHMYYVQSDGSLQGVTGTTTKVEEPKYSVTGTIHIENKTSQGFDVVVTNVSSTKGVKTVKLPVWSSQGGQDDVIWYDAIKQTDGTYKLSVDIRRHKNNRGEYNIHMYYVQSDGSLQGVTGTTTKVEGPQTGAKEVQYNGSYYFIQGKYDEIVVANKKHPMAANYNPGENPTAKAAFLRLRNDMIAQGYNVGYAYSGFRSYDYQKVLYQNYVNKDGQAAADRYSARPGYSEHQTGLVFDLTDKAGNLLEDAAASNWLKNNAHRYGFVVRYQPGKEASTGYMPEAWHIRYIGKEADEVYHSGLSLEEYYGFEGGDYASSVTPSKPTTPSPQTPSIPAQGVYRFTKRSSIKAEARMSAPELAYYDAGQSVTYDKVLNADGATWISYIAFSGKRRYIAVA
ncbi:LD-carboxypeptidase LdcB/DacB [Streptococcus anginosus]|uniref:Surface antigen n=3 Tax=Bacilli TaxID=91061 RepID=A0A448AIZ2_STRAP|nr:LD-carboxypeptidase LdcB/DacB [Streptococcus anginosus]EGL44082.1 Gram-positive signal peptide protein, YSIRK family [Streptococcus anginosus SK52 = DSM 20563]MBZ2158227.1 GBS Bsp-like repeat-containing protein [Streptococcus anginosus]ORE82009.1 signal peptide protein [Streptococcus anginosus SK52 = DSM 20563]UEB01463.1 GBS Bsp-like repeat-containing protein [Streptococcus anginosus subsp. anginosus]VED98332.1 surface antigen [Streptococcus anginosus]